MMGGKDKRDEGDKGMKGKIEATASRTKTSWKND